MAERERGMGQMESGLGRREPMRLVRCHETRQCTAHTWCCKQNEQLPNHKKKLAIADVMDKYVKNYRFTIQFDNPENETPLKSNMKNLTDKKTMAITLLVIQLSFTTLKATAERCSQPTQHRSLTPSVRPPPADHRGTSCSRLLL